MRYLNPRTREQGATPRLWHDNDFSSLGSFRREMDRLFDDFFRAPKGFGSPAGAATATWPSIDVRQSDNEVTVTAEVPGMTDKDVELFVEDGILTIRGDREADQEREGYSERFYGHFERQVPLPANVDEEHCTADFHDGLLTIHLPKSRNAEESRKKIPINADTRH